MRIRAILFSYDKKIKEFEIEACPYGLYVFADDARDFELEESLLERGMRYLREGMVTRQELGRYGGERPEGYVYAYAMLMQFAMPDNGYWISFPDEDLFTLYPGDCTYQRIDFLKKEMPTDNKTA